MKRTPPPGAYVGSEEAFQRTAIVAVRAILSSANLPSACAMHVPNGGARDAVTGAKMKAAGVVRGYPDIMVFSLEHMRSVSARNGFGDRRCGLALELKVWPNKLSVDQERIHWILRNAGWRVVTCYSLDEVIYESKQYLGAR